MSRPIDPAQQPPHSPHFGRIVADLAALLQLPTIGDSYAVDSERLKPHIQNIRDAANALHGQWQQEMEARQKRLTVAIAAAHDNADPVDVVAAHRHVSREEAAELMRAALAAQQPAIPPGYALVPVEPTLEQQQAGCSAPILNPAAIYRAMLAAAPAVPAASELERLRAVAEALRTAGVQALEALSVSTVSPRGEALRQAAREALRPAIDAATGAAWLSGEPAASGEPNGDATQALLEWNRAQSEPPIRIGFEGAVACEALRLSAAASGEQAAQKEPTFMERQMLAALADIAQAVGIGEDGTGDPDEILSAIDDLKLAAAGPSAALADQIADTWPDCKYTLDEIAERIKGMAGTTGGAHG